MRARSGAVAAIAFVVIGCASSPLPSSGSTAGPTASATPITSEAPSVPPPTVAPPSPEPSVPAALAWQEVGPQVGGEMAGFGGGYVALANQDVDSKVLYSADGVSWKSVSLPFPASKDSHGNALDAHTEAIASNGPQVIVVGGYFHTPCATSNGGAGGGPLCPSSPIAWLTSDGTHWQSSYPWHGPGPAKGSKQGNELIAAWAMPGNGWGAATMDVGGEEGSAGPIFHSPNGLSWSESPGPSPIRPGSSESTAFWHLGLADAIGEQLVGGYWYPDGNQQIGLFSTRDGKTWSAVKSFPRANTSVVAGIAPSDSLASLWILAGSDAMTLPTVWTSPDLVTWTAHELPTLPGAEGALSSIALTHLGYVATGQLSGGTDGNGYHSSWVSTDGVNWIQIDTPNTPDGDGPDVLADGPGGVIGFAQYNGTSTPVGAWLLK